jgi:hypothetical protein
VRFRPGAAHRLFGLDISTIADRQVVLAETLDRFYATDLSVHRWDVAQAANLPTKAFIDDDEIAIVNDQLGSIDAAIIRSPDLFDPPVETATDASPTDRLMAWLGRTPC